MGILEPRVHHFIGDPQRHVKPGRTAIRHMSIVKAMRHLIEEVTETRLHHHMRWCLDERGDGFGSHFSKGYFSRP